MNIPSHSQIQTWIHEDRRQKAQEAQFQHLLARQGASQNATWEQIRQKMEGVTPASKNPLVFA
jgi:hypothetical protein